MDSTISDQVRTRRKEKLKSLFAEMLNRVELSDSGEFYITWKGSSVQMKFSQWFIDKSPLPVV